MYEHNKIDEKLFKKIKPICGQLPRLYGLAKVHKQNVPVRRILCMPGLPYH